MRHVRVISVACEPRFFCPRCRDALTAFFG